MEHALARRARPWADWALLPHPLGKPLLSLRCRTVETLPIVSPQISVNSTAQPEGLLQYRVEHRREVAGRVVDNLQYLGGRGLLPQGLARLGQEPREIGRASC